MTPTTEEAEALRSVRIGSDADLAGADLIADAVGLEREAALTRRFGDSFSLALADRYQRAAAALRHVGAER